MDDNVQGSIINCSELLMEMAVTPNTGRKSVMMDPQEDRDIESVEDSPKTVYDQGLIPKKQANQGTGELTERREEPNTQQDNECLEDGKDPVETGTVTNQIKALFQCISEVVSTLTHLEPVASTMLQTSLLNTKRMILGQQAVRPQPGHWKTYTYVEIPTFTAENTAIDYTVDDIKELAGQQFCGLDKPIENLRKLSHMVHTIGQIAQLKQLTENSTTGILFRFLTTPAKQLVHNFKTQHELEYGYNKTPTLENIVRHLEQHFVKITPQQAEEQLMLLQRKKQESIMQFFDRADIIAHMASFTYRDKRNRENFKEESLKSIIVNNMSPQDHASLLRNHDLHIPQSEDQLTPHQILAHLRRQKVDMPISPLLQPQLENIGWEEEQIPDLTLVGTGKKTNKKQTTNNLWSINSHKKAKKLKNKAARKAKHREKCVKWIQHYNIQDAHEDIQTPGYLTGSNTCAIGYEDKYGQLGIQTQGVWIDPRWKEAMKGYNPTRWEIQPEQVTNLTMKAGGTIPALASEGEEIIGILTTSGQMDTTSMSPVDDKAMSSSVG